MPEPTPAPGRVRRAVTLVGVNYVQIALTILLALIGLPMMGSSFSGCSPSPRPEPTPIIPVEVHFKPGAFASVSATEPVTFVVTDFDWHADADQVWFVTPQTPGPYHIYAYTTSRSWLPWGKPNIGGPYTTRVVVDDAPTPVPPVPPIPPVPPVPPVPPAPVDKPCVLILFDDAKITAMPAAQQAIIFGKEFRDYLDAKLPAGADGTTKEWRIWPAVADVSGVQSGALKTAFLRSHPTLPWIVISNGTSGFEGPLPATSDEALVLVKKYLP